MKNLLLFVLLASLTTVAFDVKTIYHAAGELSSMDKFAVKELSVHLEKALGHKIQIAVEDSQPAKDAIYLGHTKFASTKNIDFSAFQQEEWLVRECGGAVVLGGHKIHGNLYAVYEFLERFAHVYWLDEKTTVIPQLAALDVPSDMELRGKPSVRFRGIYTYKPHDNNVNLFKLRNRENIFWEKPAKLPYDVGFRPVLGRPRPLNTFFFYVNDWPKDGFEQFYSQDIKGRRERPKNEYGPGQICFSNKDCQDKFAKQMIDYIAKDREEFPEEYPLLYNLSANDCKDTCYCDECQALAKKYNAQSGAMMTFVNAVAEQVGKVYPDVTIQTSAYMLFEKAPTGIGVNPNVAVRSSLYPAGMGMDTMRSINHPTNRRTLNELQKWAKLGRIQIWNYWVAYGDPTQSNICLVNIDAIQDNVRTYHRLGADYIFTECEYPDTTTFHSLRVWFGYRVLNDVDVDKEALLNRFFTNYYGPAAPFMREYYDYLCKRQPEAKRLEGKLLFSRSYIDQEFFDTCFPLLKKAQTAVKDDPLLSTHVLCELVPLEIAAIIFTPTENSFVPSKEELLSRIADQWKALVDYYWGKTSAFVHSRKIPVQQEIKDFLVLTALPKSGATYPIPPEAVGRTVYEITHDEFNKLSETKFYGMKLVKDADSPTGMAMTMAKARTEDFHQDILTAGFQDRSIMKGFHSYEFKRDTLPQDERYHFHHIGTVDLHVASLFWMHRTWFIQQDFSRFFRRGADNRFDVYVSVKFTGPSYVKGSSKEDAISIDRFLLVRP